MILEALPIRGSLSLTLASKKADSTSGGATSAKALTEKASVFTTNANNIEELQESIKGGDQSTHNSHLPFRTMQPENYNFRIA